MPKLVLWHPSQEPKTMDTAPGTISLRDMQWIVDGPIEIFYFDNEVVGVVNEEGRIHKLGFLTFHKKAMTLPVNRNLYHYGASVFGTMVFAKENETGFLPLDDETAKWVMDELIPNRFIQFPFVKR